MELRGPRSEAPQRLEANDYATIIARLSEAKLNWNGGPQGEELLAGVRSTYEPLVHLLADHLLIDIPAWLPAGEAADHWERGPRGIIARRLIQGLATGDMTPDSVGSTGRINSRAGRLRRQTK
jgi:hypothetical protein